jgi:hypothetical protein
MGAKAKTVIPQASGRCRVAPLSSLVASKLPVCFRPSEAWPKPRNSAARQIFATGQNQCDEVLVP